MKKKIIIAIAILLFVTIGGYFAYKGVNLYNYTSNDAINLEEYDELMNSVKIEGTNTIKKVNIPEEEYLAFQNMKIINEFKELQKMDEGKDKYVRYSLRDDNDKLISSFAMGADYSFIEMFKSSEISIMGVEKSYFEKIDRASILKNNNIKTDIELIQYILNNKDRKSNIFTSIKDMQEIYSLQLFASIMLSKSTITLLDGDYTGYITNLDSSSGHIREYSILHNNRKYFFQFVWPTDYFSEESISEMINTIVID